MTAEARHKVSESIPWNLFVAPIVGLLYVIAFPFIAVGTVLAVAGKGVLGVVADIGGSLVSFAWRPSEAYLAGKKKGKKKE